MEKYGILKFQMRRNPDYKVMKANSSAAGLFGGMNQNQNQQPESSSEQSDSSMFDLLFFIIIVADSIISLLSGQNC